MLTFSENMLEYVYKATIAVVDNDYRAVSYYEEKKFKDKQSALDYCVKNTWDGESYILVSK